MDNINTHARTIVGIITNEIIKSIGTIIFKIYFNDTILRYDMIFICFIPFDDL